MEERIKMFKASLNRDQIADLRARKFVIDNRDGKLYQRKKARRGKPKNQFEDLNPWSRKTYRYRDWREIFQEKQQMSMS